MGIEDFIDSDFEKSDDHQSLKREEVTNKIEELTGVLPIQKSNGPRFYADTGTNGEGKNGTLFCAILPSIRVYLDPTAKRTVFGQTPRYIRENPDFEETKSYSESLNYSMKLRGKEEIPDEVKRAVEWSYEQVQ